MGLWKTMFGEPEREEPRQGTWFRRRVVVEYKKPAKGADYRSGKLYLRISRHTYLVIPGRSEVNQNLDLKEGDEVVLTIEKIN